MSKKRKLITFILAGVAFLAIASLAIRLIINRDCRNKLPDLPEFSNVNTSLKEQITNAYNNAYSYPTSDNLGKLGMVYNSGAYYDKAAKCYQLAISKNKNNWIWIYYLGYIKLELGDSKDAIRYFSKVTEINPKAYMALYYTGEAYHLLNSIDTAERIMLKIAGMKDRNFYIKKTLRTSYFQLPVYAKFQLARIYIKTNRLDFAEKQLKEIIRDQITFGPAYRQLGSLFAIKGDSILSRHYTSRANDLYVYASPLDTLIDRLYLMSRSDEFMMKQIDLAIRSGNSDWAMKLLTHGLKYFPDNKYLISKAIRQFSNTGFGDYTIPYLEKHIKFFSDNYEELTEVGTLLADAGFKTYAMKYYLKAESLKNEKPEDRSALALMFFDKVIMKENALDLITEEIEKNPGNLKILSDGYSLFLKMDEKGKALRCLNRLKQLSPSHPDVKIFTGLIAENEGNLNEAIVLYEQAFKAKPKNVSLINHLGNIYTREKMWSQAIDFFRKALEYYPNDSYFQVKLGDLLVTCPDEKLRNLSEGREYAERAFINCIYSEQTRISAGKTLAIAYNELGDRNKAYFYIGRTIELARKAHAHEEYLASLENLSKQFSHAK